MTHHKAQCGWHCDQYDFECDCGAARAATLNWAQREVSSAKYAVELAQERLAAAEKRLREWGADEKA